MDYWKGKVYITPFKGAIKGKKKDPDKTFEGNPCRTCGSKIRYINRKTCVECASVNNRRSRNKRLGTDMSLVEKRRKAEEMAESRKDEYDY